MKLNLQVVATLLAGGLGGAVFTWWINRHPPATVTYGVTTTTLGADAKVRGLIPNLKLQIGSEEVPVIHTHTVEFRVPQDYVESAEVAILFPKKLRLYGSILAEAPSPLQKISCTPIDEGTRCTMGPLKAGEGSFKVTLATDVEQAPTAQMVAKNVELQKADTFVAQTGWSILQNVGFALLTAGGALVLGKELVIQLSVHRQR